MEPETSVLSAWESFYVIIGSSAAALTGLQFVVITLIADSRMRHSQREINAFGTPIVVHFSVVLLISGVLSAPWPGQARPGLWVSIIGLAGVVYAVITRIRVKRQGKVEGAYQPTTDDVIWYQLCPALGYAGLLGAGIWMQSDQPRALYLVAGLVLYLLLVSIRNAWDTVTFVAETRGQDL